MARQQANCYQNEHSTLFFTRWLHFKLPHWRFALPGAYPSEHRPGDGLLHMAMFPFFPIDEFMVLALEKQDEAHEPECRHVCWRTETILITFSSEPTCGTPWRDTLRWHSCRTPFLLDTLTWHSCKTLVLDTLLRHSYLTLLTWHLVRHSYWTLLLDTPLGHSYWTFL